MWETCPKIISSQGEEIGVDSEIGHNGANRKLYVQRKRESGDIKNPKSREIRKQRKGSMRDIGHNGASRSEYVQK